MAEGEAVAFMVFLWRRTIGGWEFLCHRRVQQKCVLGIRKYGYVGCMNQLGGGRICYSQRIYTEIRFEMW